MANRKKSRRLPPSRVPEIPSQSEQPTRLTLPPDRHEGRGRVRKAIGKFAEWAVGKAFDYLLVGVLALVTAPALAIWVYFRSGRAVWTYPWLYAALGFSTACVVIIFMASLLGFVRAQRRRAAERAINLEFLSKDKGYMDHAVNQIKAFKTFNTLLSEMANEMGKIAKTNQAATAQIHLAKRLIGARPNLLAFFGHKIASRAAKKLNKHAASMQSSLSQIEVTSDLLIESISGYTSWFPADTAEQAQILINNRTALDTMTSTMETTIGSTQGFRDSQQSIYGISQELNTAVNRMTNVTDGVITFLRSSNDKWSTVIGLMDEKIRAWAVTQEAQK